MKKYSVDRLTVDDIQEMIANGDDNHNNQIRVTKDGYVFLPQDIVGAQALDNIQYRFESFDAGNDYVGYKASKDSSWINKLYRNIIGY